MYGWAGKILKIDLTKRKMDIVPTSDYVPKYIGGRGLAARIYWEEVPPAAGAFDPENRLVLTTGPLQGTLAPTSGRFMVVGKAPQTAPVESYTRSGCGGHWAPELKWAGYDAVVISGRSEKPVYVLIRDDDVQIKDASTLWGKDIFTTQDLLWKAHGPQTRVVTIGKAGETKTRLGIILTDSGDASGQGGFGGVMGSKNLKAVAVQGTGSIQVARPKELMELTTVIRNLFSRPSKPGSFLEPSEPGFKYNIWGGAGRGDATGGPGELWALCSDPKSGYERLPDACYACPIGCRSRVRGPDITNGVAQCTQSNMYLESIIKDPEKGYSKLTWEAGRMADYYGINAYELHGMLPWLAACYEEEVLTVKETGLPLDDIGGRTFISELLRKIAHREGFGDLLAEGVQRAATRLGGQAEELMHVLYPRAGKFGGYREHWLYYGGFPEGYAVPPLALIWVLDNRDAMVSHNLMSQLWGASVALGYSANSAELEELIPLVKPTMKHAYGSEKAAEFLTPDGQGLNWEWSPRIAQRFFERTILKDSYIVCDVAFPFLFNPNTEDHVGDSSLESRLYRAVTGVDLSEAESYEVGDMLCALERAIQVREGRTRDDDVLREICYTTEDAGERRYLREDLEKAKDAYYELMGWDRKGLPKADRLTALDLADVAEGLKGQTVTGTVLG